MPVYSDAAVQGWLETACPDRAAALSAKNPGNAQWLVEALLRAAKAAGRGAPGEPFPRRLSVQLLHREGDPQLSELQVLAGLLPPREPRAGGACAGAGGGAAGRPARRGPPPAEIRRAPGWCRS